MLKRFIKPRWQHKDPAVRAAAVAGLDDDALLARIAREDEDPAVRHAALGAIGHLDALLQVPAERVGAQAWQAQFDRLLTREPEALQWSERLARALRHHADPARLAEVAPRLGDARLRELAARRIDDPETLARLCSDDPDGAVRQAAARRLDDEALLRRCLKRLGKRDKRTSQLLRERLEALQAAREAAAARQALADELDSLGRGERWQRDQTRLQVLRGQWQAAREESPEDERARIDAALQAAETRIAEQRARQDELAPAIAAKTEQCELAETFAERLRGRLRLAPGEAEELQATLDVLRADWAALPVLPERQEAPLANRFHAALAECRRLVDELRASASRCAELERLLQRAERELGRKVVRARVMEEIETAWAAQKLPPNPALAEEYRNQFQRLRDRLQARLAQQAARREQGLAEIEGWLEQIATWLEEDRLGESDRLEARIRQRLGELPELPAERRKAIEARLREFAPRIRELRSWRHWGTDRAREELIAEAEALREQPQTPAERAKAVKALRERWKKLGRIDPAIARPLWKRFDAACNAAYQLVAEHRAAEAERRQRHLAQREAICAELEALAHDTDWSQPDWRAIDKRYHALQNRWRKAGPVDRVDWEAIHARYRAAVAALEEHLAPERERSRRAREALIAEVEALRDSEDLAAALRAARAAQRAWQPTVAGRQRDEQRLWKRFRAALDAVYERDRARRDAAGRAQRARLEAMEALCAEAEQLARQPAEVPRALEALEQRWAELDIPRGREAEALTRRFQAAGRAARQAWQQWEARQTEAEMDQLLAQHALLTELESACLTGCDDATLARYTERWDAISRGAPARMEERFETADALPRLPAETLAEHAARRADLLLDLEILLNVPSPPEHQAERMARQVERLNATLHGGHGGDPVEEALHLLRRYTTVGPVSAAQAAREQARLDAVAAALRARLRGEDTAS